MSHWSPQQQEIFRWFAGQIPGDNLVIRARAGTGKTTTILEAIKHAPESKILLAAFNKTIASELADRIGRNPSVRAQTLHSLGYYYCRRKWTGINVDAKRGRKLADKAIPKGLPRDKATIGVIANIASAGKNITPFADQHTLTSIATAFGHLPAQDSAYTVEDVAKFAHTAMALACEHDGTVDFDDMVYLPVRNRWIFPIYFLTVIDEAQDMNPVQLMLARAATRKNGRIAVVGDDKQAIYGFRGADSHALDNLKRDLDAVELGLTVTYRCPKLVVAQAQELVPDYEAHDTAPEGIVDDIDTPEIIGAAEPGHFVLSRTNAPLAQTCLALLRNGKRAVVRGRDIGANLSNFVKDIVQASGAENIEQFAAGVENWRKNRTELLQGEDADDAAFELVHDQADTLLALADGLATPKEVLARIDSLFSDNNTKNSIVCSTVHKAKGLEADRVFVLTDTFKQSGEEENNIAYVAYTRAKNHLTFASGEAVS